MSWWSPLYALPLRLFLLIQTFQISNFDLDSDPSLSLSPLEAVPAHEEDLAYDFFLADCYDLFDLQ